MMKSEIVNICSLEGPEGDSLTTKQNLVPGRIRTFRGT